MNKKVALIILLMATAMATRFIFIVDGVSILPNFVAVGAIAIFGAAHLKGVLRWIVPLAILWASDLILNNVIYAEYFDHFQVMGSLWVYGSFFLVGCLAVILMQKASWTRLVVTALGGGVLFFLITNFSVWMSASSPYPKDFSGLIACYQAGIPFFRNTILGNLFYSFVLFGAYEYLAVRFNFIAPLLIVREPYSETI